MDTAATWSSSGSPEDQKETILNELRSLYKNCQSWFQELDKDIQKLNTHAIDATLKEVFKAFNILDGFLKRVQVLKIRNPSVVDSQYRKSVLEFLEETLTSFEKLSLEELHRTIPEHAHLKHMVHEYEQHILETNEAHQKWRAKWKAYWTAQEKRRQLIAQGITSIVDDPSQYQELRTYTRGDFGPLISVVAEEVSVNAKAPSGKERSPRELAQSIVKRLSAQYPSSALEAYRRSEFGISKGASQELVKFIELAHSAAKQEEAKAESVYVDDASLYRIEQNTYLSSWDQYSRDRLLNSAKQELPWGAEQFKLAALQKEIANEEARFLKTDTKNTDQLLRFAPTIGQEFNNEIAFQRFALEDFYRINGSDARLMDYGIKNGLIFNRLTAEEYRLWREAGIIPKGIRSEVLRFFSDKVDPATLARYDQMLTEYQDLKRLLSTRLGVAFNKAGIHISSPSLLRLSEEIQGLSPTRAGLISRLFQGSNSYRKWLQIKGYYDLATKTPIVKRLVTQRILAPLFQQLLTKYPFLQNVVNALGLPRFFNSALGRVLGRGLHAVLGWLENTFPGLSQLFNGAANLWRALPQIASYVGQMLSRVAIQALQAGLRAAAWAAQQLVTLLARLATWLAQVAIPAIEAAIATAPAWLPVALIVGIVLIVVIFVFDVLPVTATPEEQIAAALIPAGEEVEFVTGGGPPGNLPPGGRDYIDPEGCEVPQGNEICCVPREGYCSLNNPETRLQERFGSEARNAAQVCLRESVGGIADVINDGCLPCNPQTTANGCECAGRTWVKRCDWQSWDYSVGLFQANMLALCCQAFNHPVQCGRIPPPGTTCSVRDWNVLNECVAKYQDPAFSAQFAKNLLDSRNSDSNPNNDGWYPAWGAAKSCNIP